MTPKPPAIDIATLPLHFDSTAAETRWQLRWDELGVYAYDPGRPREDTFVVDTPPPTVSGSLHIGHVFSYTHTDVIVRHRRMCGQNIFYPMGWDDNGLPTERRVQNYFHVRVNADTPYDPGLKVDAADAAACKLPPRLVSRPNFIELCQRVTRQDEQAFMALWKRLGLSVDWSQEYSTIDPNCRRLAQYSFLDLYRQGHVYSLDAPTMWDVDFQTAVAQAEVEDRVAPGAFHQVAFGIEGTEEHLVVATTRPELLPACVGVTAHPDDPRYRHLFGKRAVTPVFRLPVPIFPSPLADPSKGTGILMVCTFGDQTDVVWWQKEELALRQILGRDGRLVRVVFGTPGWESLAPEAANLAYQSLIGKTVKQARRAVVEMLRDPAHCPAPGLRAALMDEPKPVERPVKFYEKGDQPLEFVPTRQWFVRLMDKKEALLSKGDAIHWHPEFMGVRFKNWTEGLAQDWCISRQRYFGVPFPVWYRLDAQGVPDYEHPILAPEESLPADPMTDVPPGFSPSERGQPGGFLGESDVFDTWFTSSLTPQIGSRWVLDRERHRALFPADIRPQSHEIIRTWAFYTVAKAMLHEASVPWYHVIISGWILDPDRKKMSKSRGNVVTPMHLLDTYSADAVRYWAASARLGTDTAFDEKVLKVGRRLVTKIFNAGKYVLAQRWTEAGKITEEIDRAFVHQLRQLVKTASAAFSEFDYAASLKETEAFFWNWFTDSYLELVKVRARGGPETGEAAGGSAVEALRLGLSVLLRLFAPVLPYVTEEVWSWAFAGDTGQPSIHRAPWPTTDELGRVGEPRHALSLEVARDCLVAINKRKSEAGVSTGRPVDSLDLGVNPSTAVVLEPVLSDVLGAVRCRAHTLRRNPETPEGVIEILGIELAASADQDKAHGVGGREPKTAD